MDVPMRKSSLLLVLLLSVTGTASGVSAVTGVQTCKLDPALEFDPAAARAGKKVFIRCASCHNVHSSGSMRVGPDLETMFDGKPLAAEYNYSKAFREAAPDWRDEGDLRAFLARPSALVPGTKMVFAGLKQAKDRRNVVAYLKSEITKIKCD